MLVEEQGVKYEDKNVAFTVRMCILTDRMVTMMCAEFAFKEIKEKFLSDNYTEIQIARAYNQILEAGKSYTYRPETT